MSALTTHVLDLTHGVPAKGVRVVLTVFGSDGTADWLVDVKTTADGRMDKPLLSGETFKAGRYRLEFHVAAYFQELGVTLPDPPFLDVVTIDFGIADLDRHYHVPLLV